MTITINSQIRLEISLLITICLLSVPAYAKYGGGMGEPNDPYLIYTSEQLNAIAVEPNDWDKHFKLMADIDLSGGIRTGFNCIGHSQTGFLGSFNGNGHVIYNLVIVSRDTEPVGLFSNVNRGARIERLGIVNAQVSAAGTVGILAGENAGTITACYSTGIVKCLPQSKNTRSKPPNETEETTESKLAYEHMMMEYRRMVTESGGIFPPDYPPSPEPPPRAGGLVGMNYRYIESCYSEADVSFNIDDFNEIEAGGLVGANMGLIAASYSVGPVSQGGGGFLGRNNFNDSENKGDIYLCFWDVETSRTGHSAGGMGEQTDKMKKINTYLGWDYGRHWTIRDGKDYPRLQWERQAGSPVPGLAEYIEGTGQSNDPFIIRTAEQLTLQGRFRSAWDKHFKLADNIDLNGIDPNNIIVIGMLRLPFTGVFDGNGHSISNFTYTEDADESAGFFGTVGDIVWDRVSQRGLVKNLSLTKACVRGQNKVGLLVGDNYGTLRNCHVEGTVVGTDSFIGGLVGLSRGHIDSCSSKGCVRGRNYVGGLAGSDRSNAKETKDCYSACKVSGKGQVGGLAGEASCTMKYCYATGPVTGETDVGGLIGKANGHVHGCYATGSVTGRRDVGGLTGSGVFGISACYATGSVSGDRLVGGLVGSNFGGVVACYSTGKTKGNDYIEGLVSSIGTEDLSVGLVMLSYWNIETSGITTGRGGVGKSTEQLMKVETFAGWDLDGIWILNEGRDYPRLAWEGRPGKPIRSNPSRYGGGTGELDDPFQIWTKDQLCSIAIHPGDFNDHFILMADLDFADFEPNRYIPIGIRRFPFVGTFDGKGHTISNLKILRHRQDFVGFFGSVDSKNTTSRITNIHLRDAKIAAQDCAGGICGFLGKGIVTNCTVTGTITGSYHAGGLIGISYANITGCTAKVAVSVTGEAGGLLGCNAGTVERCASTGSVTGESRLGGLVGLNGNLFGPDYRPPDCPLDIGGHISQSYADCEVHGTKEIGGLVGLAWDCSRIESSYATGEVVGLSNVGGFIGSFDQAIVTGCYSTVSVQGKENTGGFVGHNRGYARRRLPGHASGIISSCFWDNDRATTSTGMGDSPDPDSLRDIGTAGLKMASTFLDADWDFVDEADNGTEDIWWILEGQDYPRLWWEARE